MIIYFIPYINNLILNYHIIEIALSIIKLILNNSDCHIVKIILSMIKLILKNYHSN